jgi:hypothetical protein
MISSHIKLYLDMLDNKTEPNIKFNRLSSALRKGLEVIW